MMLDNERRVVVDYDAVGHELDTILAEVAALRSGRTLAKTLGPAAIDELREGEATIRARRGGDFKLVVAGDFKRGKSTLINALLGMEVAPTAVTPETVTINQISYGEEFRIEAVLKNRRRVQVAREEMPRERLEAVLETLPGEVDHLEMQVPSDLLRDLTIVDTPGLGDLMHEFDDQVAAYLARADAIVFVVSALAPLSLDERNFLSSVVLPQGFSRVLVAVNMADTLEEAEDEERIARLMEQRVGEISDKLYVYPLSALDELCRALGVERPLPARADELEEDFANFREALESDVLFHRDVLKAEREISMTRHMLEQLGSRIALSQTLVRQNVDKLAEAGDALRAQDDELRARVEEHKVKLSDEVDAMRLEGKEWMREYLRRIYAELSEYARKADAHELQRHLQFYLADKLAEGVDRCLTAHGRAVSDLLGMYAHDIAGDLANTALGSVEASIVNNIADVSWTGVDTFAFGADAVLGAVGLDGGLISLGVNTVAGFFREWRVGKRQQDILGPLLTNFSEIEEGVMKSLDASYDKLRLAACNLLDETYSSQRAASAEAVENARLAMQDEDVRASDIVEVLDDALAQVSSLKQRLDEME